MDKQTVKEVSDIFTNTDKVIHETDEAIRQYNEREARRKEREQIRLDLVDRYKKLWVNNYRKLLNETVDVNYLFDLEEELRKWMHDLHDFTMKFSDDKIIFHLHWESFHIGQLLGFVEMKTKMSK